MTYDGENRMTSYNGSASYTYDGNGLRVVKSASGTTTVSIFSGSSVIAEYDNGAMPSAPSREYVYNGAGDTTGLLVMVSAGATTYYHQDHLGVRLTTDANGNVLSQQGTFPFGESWYQSGATNETVFTSYNRDSESGLDYAMARYYNSGTGAFSSADPRTGKPGDPQSWNRYPYGRNDPIGNVDPSGQSFWSNFVEGLLFVSVPLTGGATAPYAAMYAYGNTMYEAGDALMKGNYVGGALDIASLAAFSSGFSIGGVVARASAGAAGGLWDDQWSVPYRGLLPIMDNINPIISDVTNSTAMIGPDPYACAKKTATDVFKGAIYYNQVNWLAGKLDNALFGNSGDSPAANPGLPSVPGSSTIGAVSSTASFISVSQIAQGYVRQAIRGGGGTISIRKVGKLSGAIGKYTGEVGTALTAYSAYQDYQYCMGR